ncbi:hypothetical protein ACWA5Z_12395 [Testudinibacter sp. P80/BLE/0925]
MGVVVGVKANMIGDIFGDHNIPRTFPKRAKKRYLVDILNGKTYSG